MAEIDAVLESRRVKELPDLQKQLKDLKKTGREHTCLTLPNVDNIPTAKYRVQYWSEGASCIWQYDVEKGSYSKIDLAIDKAIEDGEIPSECPKTKGELLSFKEVSKEGVDCPFCHDKMVQNRWFAQEG
jgi:hypothetical protein